MTENLQLTYALAFFNAASSSMWIGSAVALSNELVLPRMRATASSFYILMMTFVGLAMGPYTMGRISDAYSNAGYAPADSLRNGIMIGFASLAIALVFLFFAGRYVEDEEKNRMERARAAGEPGL